MSIEEQIAANAAEQASTPENDAAEQAAKEVEEALGRDPHYQANKKALEDVEAVLGKEPSKSGNAKANEEAQDTETEQPGLENPKSRIAAVLKDRSARVQEQRAGKELEAQRQEATRMLAEAKAAADAVKQQTAQLQQWQQLLYQDPARALRMAGLDPEEFVFSLTKEGTEEQKLTRKLQEQDKKLQEFEDWKRQQAEEKERIAREWQEKQYYAHKGQIENSFMAMATSEKYPNVKKAIEAGLISRKALIAEGDAIADNYRDATEGAEAGIEDILDYIDGTVKDAISKLGIGGQPVRQPTNGTKPPRAQPAAEIRETLTQEDAGERRALSPDKLSEDAEERKAQARRAVKAVLERQHKAA